MPKFKREDWPANYLVREIICPICKRDCWGISTGIYCSTTCRTRAWKIRNGLLPKPAGLDIELISQVLFKPKEKISEHKNSNAEILPPARNISAIKSVESPSTVRKSWVLRLYCLTDRDGKITSKQFSKLSDFKPGEKVKVWFGGQLVEIDAIDIESHFEWMEKRSR